MPVLHSENLPIPHQTQIQTALMRHQTSDTDTDLSNDPEFDPQASNKPCNQHLVQQGELNDLVRDIGLCEFKSKVLGSRMQQWRCLDKKTRITEFRKRNARLTSFFNDIDGLIGQQFRKSI